MEIRWILGRLGGSWGNLPQPLQCIWPLPSELLRECGQDYSFAVGSEKTPPRVHVPANACYRVVRPGPIRQDYLGKSANCRECSDAARGNAPRTTGRMPTHPSHVRHSEVFASPLDPPAAGHLGHLPAFGSQPHARICLSAIQAECTSAPDHAFLITEYEFLMLVVLHFPTPRIQQYPLCYPPIYRLRYRWITINHLLSALRTY